MIEVDHKTKSTKIWSTQIQMIPQFFLIQIPSTYLYKDIAIIFNEKNA